jgi:ABC-type Fe3+-hydroxamate transport system substrate-binding protein
MKRSFTDMTGKVVEVEYPVKRIVSLVPSQTELLYDLGLDAEVVGITKFCVHPDQWFRFKKRVGGTKKINIETIKDLAPDMVIANKEENEKDQVEELAKNFPVWTSDIRTVSEGLKMIGEVGSLTGKELEANNLVNNISAGFQTMQQGEARSVAYFIWYNPWMVAGGDTFISNMIESIGWKNVFKEEMRYPEVRLEKLSELAPDLVLLSSEPFPFKEKHVAEIRSQLPDADIKLVDGEMFSWYGSRMLKAIPYFNTLINH